MQVNIALLTETDTRTIDTDKSGAILVKKIKEQNHNLIDRKIIKDEKKEIKKILTEWIKKDNLDVIITTGGTGLTGRDITPEAIKEITNAGDGTLKGTLREREHMMGFRMNDPELKAWQGSCDLGGLVHDLDSWKARARHALRGFPSRGWPRQ